MADIPNPPAFPNMAPNSCGPHIDKRDGMTLRDWFAGQALAAVLGRRTYCSSPSFGAEDAYVYADAMLAERAKDKP